MVIVREAAKLRFFFLVDSPLRGRRVRVCPLSKKELFFIFFFKFVAV